MIRIVCRGLRITQALRLTSLTQMLRTSQSLEPLCENGGEIYFKSDT